MTKRTIEIDEDPSFQTREWVAQRVGLGVLALFLIAAVLGFTGSGGPFSHAETSDASGALRVEYDPIVRRGARSTITLHLRGGQPGLRSFWFSTDYVNGIDVETVVPDPEAVTAEGDRYVYTIRATGPDAAVTVHLRPARVGWIDVDVGVVDGPSVRFHQTSLF
jgi:hypothetical protein